MYKEAVNSKGELQMRWNDIIEHAIVGKLTADLIDEGFRIEMSDQDGGGLFVYIWRGERKPAGGVRSWVKLVPGNGADVLSDYTIDLETTLKEVNAFAAQYA